MSSSPQAIASYVAYQCTWWAAKLLDYVQPGWGNADEWAANAARAGFSVTNTPTVGSIADWSGALPGSGGAGHVAEVTGIVPGGFTVVEGNFSNPGQLDTRTVTGAGLNDLIGFIQPPGGAMGSSIPAWFTALFPNLTAAQSAWSTIQAQGGLSLPGLPNPLGSTAAAISGIPTTVGHGLADAIGVGVEDVKTFAERQVIALSVATVVLIVLFVR